MNEKHAQVTEHLNASKKEPDECKVGDLVWVLHPPPSLTAEKTLPRWVGPCPVKERLGQRSYIIQIRPGVAHAAHRSQLKPLLWSSHEGVEFPLHYFRLTPHEETQNEGEWQVEKILAHKNTPKGPMFLTKWEDFRASAATWEPIGNFFYRYANPFVDYCMSQRDQWLSVDVLPHLSRRPNG